MLHYSCKFLVCISRFLHFYFIGNFFLQGHGSEEVRVSITKSNLGRNHTPGELIFVDNFDTFDLEKWHHENTLGGATWEFQMYTNSRVMSYARDGVLFIKPTPTSDVYGVQFLYNGQWTIEGSYPSDMCTDSRNYGCKRASNYAKLLNPVMSAKLKTINSFYFKYGRVEIRAKLPGGDWMWPIIGMMPRFNSYGPWPNSGDIRIMESRGNQLFFDTTTNTNANGSTLNGSASSSESSGWRNIGTEKVTCTLHFGPNYLHDGWERTSGERASTKKGRGYDRDFHIYGFKWTDKYLEFTLDGVPTRRIYPPKGGFWELGGFEDKGAPNPWKYSTNKLMAPFDQKFYLFMNVAVGGRYYFPDPKDRAVNKKGKKPWDNDSQRAYLEFFEGRQDWEATWEGENGALQIDYVRVYAI